MPCRAATRWTHTLFSTIMNASTAPKPTHLSQSAKEFDLKQQVLQTPTAKCFCLHILFNKINGSKLKSYIYFSLSFYMQMSLNNYLICDTLLQKQQSIIHYISHVLLSTTCHSSLFFYILNVILVCPSMHMYFGLIQP